MHHVVSMTTNELWLSKIILFFVSPTFFVAFLSFRFNLVASSFYGVPSQRRTKKEERNSPSSYYPQMLGQARS